MMVARQEIRTLRTRCQVFSQGNIIVRAYIIYCKYYNDYIYIYEFAIRIARRCLNEQNCLDRRVFVARLPSDFDHRTVLLFTTTIDTFCSDRAKIKPYRDETVNGPRVLENRKSPGNLGNESEDIVN